jgi:predicted nucleic acid-binding protein
LAAYLLETSILTISLDMGHPRHGDVANTLAALPSNSMRYVSAVGLAELLFGAELARRIGNADVRSLREKIRSARAHAVLDITGHTAAAYAEIKAKVAEKYLTSTLRRDRPKYIEDWIDKATGKALGIDENDLWVCAQAKERQMTLITADHRIKRIPDADPEVSILFV